MTEPKLKVYPSGFQIFWFPVLALSVLGLIFVYSSSSVYAAQKYHDEYLFFRKQAFYFLPALAAAWIGIKVPLRFWQRVSGWLFLLSVLACFATKIPGLGLTIKGASRWLSLGGIQVQPSEFLKIATILFASQLLTRWPTQFYMLWPLGLAFLALLIQPDFGSSVIIALSLLTMIFIHGIPIKLLVGGLGLTLPLGIIIMIAEPYRIKRLVAFLNPFADPLGSGFQVIQSFVAIANGGWLGKGLGGSQQKLFFLPEAHTDFILAVIAEDMGFLGVMVLAFVYLLFFYAFIQLIKATTHHGFRLITTGILSMFAFSVMVNMGVVAGVLPTKGLTLPFISAGGSALIVNFFCVGLVTQIYNHVNSMAQQYVEKELHS